MGDILPEIRITIRGNLIRPAVIVIDRIGIVEAAAAAEAVVVGVLTVEKWDIFRGNVRIAEAEEVVAAVVAAADADDREAEEAAAAEEAVAVDASTAEKWDIFRGIVRIAEAEEVAEEAAVDAIEAEVVEDATEVAEEAAETIVLIADNRDTFRENVRKVLVEIIAEDIRFPGMVVERLKDRLWFLFRVSIGKYYSRVEGKYVSCSTCFDRKNWTVILRRNIS